MLEGANAALEEESVRGFCLPELPVNQAPPVGIKCGSYRTFVSPEYFFLRVKITLSEERTADANK